MNAEQFFWMINEIVQQEMSQMSEADRENIMETLVKDTDNTLLSFDLESIMENIR